MAINNIIVSSDGGSGLTVLLVSNDGSVSAQDVDPVAIESAVNDHFSARKDSIVAAFNSLDDNSKTQAMSEIQADFVSLGVSKSVVG